MVCLTHASVNTYGGRPVVLHKQYRDLPSYQRPERSAMMLNTTYRQDTHELPYVGLGRYVDGVFCQHHETTWSVMRMLGIDGSHR
jgi:hypothetical protein